MRYAILFLAFVVLTSGCTGTGWSVENDLGTKYGIFVMDPGGSGVRQVYGSDKPVSNAFPSPDGSRIVFYGSDADMLGSIATSEIYMINTDGSGYRKLTDNTWMDFQPRWSPEGSEILFISDGGKGAGTDIYVMSPGGEILRQLTDTPGISEADPDWKCGKVVFTREHSIWIMDENGSGQQKLTEPPGKGADVGVQFPLGDYDPNLSPDCKRVVFERLVGSGKNVGGTNIGDYDLYVYDIPAATETDISLSDVADFIPKWSQDGKIIFIRVTDEPEDIYDIFMINPDGTGLKKVTGSDPPGFVENGCSWFGDRIMFTAEWFG